MENFLQTQPSGAQCKNKFHSPAAAIFFEQDHLKAEKAHSSQLFCIVAQPVCSRNGQNNTP
jgi:hypothetical protein